MTTRGTVWAFAVTFLLAWGQLGGVAAAQREPVAPAVEHTAPEASSHDARASESLDLHGPRRNPSRIAGYALVPVGALGMGGGLVLALVGSLVAHPICWSECSGHDATGWFAAAGLAGGAGLLALISGITLIATNPSWDEANVPNLRIALAPTEGGAYASVSVDF